jgi:hypothetical protein
LEHNNFLSEFSTEVQKARARKNLGIKDVQENFIICEDLAEFK